MSSEFQEDEMTPQEWELAYNHWEALMFSDSRVDLEQAQLALLEAPNTVRQAVMNSITDFWLREHQPRREENPFK